MADRIELKGLECFAHHGVFDWEKQQGQPFIADVTCWLDFSAAAETDDLGKTIDYGELATVVADVIEGPPKNLIETVATDVAEQLMEKYASLDAVEVRIHKPQAPIPRSFSDIAVIARRSRKRRRLGREL